MKVHGHWMQWLLALLLAAGAATSGDAAETERIISFDSYVEIHSDGSQVVSETIHVMSDMKKIRHGIYRDFPLRSVTTNSVSFNVLSVTIDGIDSRDYRVERSAGKARVMIGSKHSFLPPGEHTFVLTYETGGHVQYLDGHAEFGWNVTGDGWDFTIENASCYITLPEGGEIEETTGWLGRTDSRESPIEISRPQPGAALFVARKKIVKGEHFTVAVRFPESLVANYAHGQTLRTVLIVALVLLYFLVTWLVWGRDPKPGTIIPLFHPPTAGYYGDRSGVARNARSGVISPAAASYVKNAAFLDARGFASIFISLGAKGACTLNNYGSDSFSVTPLAIDQSEKDKLPEEERSVHEALVRAEGTNRAFALSSANATKIREMHDSVVEILGRRYAPLWAQNIWIQAIGWLVVLPAAFLAMNQTGVDVLSALLPPALLTGLIFLIRKQIAYSWSRSINSVNPAKYLFIGVFLAARTRVLSVIITMIGLSAYQVYSVTLPSLALVAVAMLFCPQMKAPSPTGRKLLDKIGGLLMYINVAEHDRLKALNPPDDTPETFERILPYAVAFGLEETWCARFAEALTVKPPAEGGDDRPWRHYRMFRHRRSRSFSNSVAKAATPPPSTKGSSGSGGGSFFGGGGGGAGRGGGGGGGGGW